MEKMDPRPYALAVEVIPMDAKAEKIALFRYGLIAPLVLEALPRGELTRRAEDTTLSTAS